MKITQNSIPFTITSVMEKSPEKTNLQQGKNRLFAGGMTGTDPMDMQIAGRREEAMQKARKIIGDVYVAEKSIDDDLAERAGRIEESKQSIVEANKELKALREEQEKLKEQYGITGEEAEEELPEEYKMQHAELERYGEPFRQTVTEAEKVIREETAIIQAVKLERLKSSPMVAASEEAEEIIETAEENILTMLLDEGKEKIEETTEECKEKQEQLEEKERLKEAKEKERKERTELPEASMKELLELENVKKEMKQEVDQMLTEMKLLAEDIKGSMLDVEK